MIFSMNNDEIIRYKRTKYFATKFLAENNISDYPIYIEKIKEYIPNCRIQPYSTHMVKHNLTIKEVLDFYGSEEGCTCYSSSRDKYIIFFNDLSTYYKVPGRIRWTILHEVGHIVLGHLKEINETKIFRNALSNNEYKNLEKEANRFASLVLANPIILHTLNINTEHDLKLRCGLSSEAAGYRFKEYTYWMKNKYMSFYDSVILQNVKGKVRHKYCLCCGHGIKANKNIKYCPICGHENLTLGDGNMIYDSIDINNKSKAKICPICKNENTDIEGGFCQICGTYIKNECTNQNCHSELLGEDRYCPICGASSTFFENNLLKSWDVINIDDNEMPF